MLKQRFHKGWKFIEGEDNVFAALVQDGKQENTVNLPHDASITSKREKGDSFGSGNGFFVEKNYVYSKDFILDEKEKEKVVWLEFEGIYQNAFVYINGAFAGKCAYGYGNFYIDATKYVQFGSKNHIKLIIKNGLASGRWYTGGGIYRDVNLMIADRLHIMPDGVKVTVEDIEEDLAKVRVDTEIHYDGIGSKNVQLITEFTDLSGNTVAEEKSTLTVFEGTEASYCQKLYVRNPILWDADHPCLYQYHTYIVDRDKTCTIDEESGSFGIRKLQLDPMHGLRINGKTVYLRGGCIHHDNGLIGAAEFTHAAESRIKALRKAGYNAIRSAHYPMSRALLQACDQYGMYVMDEYTDVWTSSKVAFDYGTQMSGWWEHDVANMVRKDYNHPCVIMYSIGNEIPEIGNKIDVQWGKKIADKIRSLDSSRYLTNGMNLLMAMADQLKEMMSGDVAADDEMSVEINNMMANLGGGMQLLTESDMAAKTIEEASSQLDVVGYNYAAGRYEKDRTLYPNRILVGSETYPKDLDKNWELVEKYPHVIGDFSWTAWDYLGEAGIGKIRYGNVDMGMGIYAPYPCKAAYCGDLNLLGNRRPVSYWREIIWGLRKAPYICVQPPEHFGEEKKMTDWSMTDAVRSWNFAGFENKPVIIEVYTDAEEAELLVNDVSVKRSKVGKEKKDIVLFQTEYKPGIIEVIAYKDGKEYGRDCIQTAGQSIYLEAHSDMDVIPADGSDICYVDLSVIDENGVLNPDNVQNVTVEIEGPGVIIGYGSADPDSEENYFDVTAKTYEGRLRAVVRATGTPGKITVIFHAPGNKKCRTEVMAQ